MLYIYFIIQKEKKTKSAALKKFFLELRFIF